MENVHRRWCGPAPKGQQGGKRKGKGKGRDRREGRGSEVSAIRLPATLALVFAADQEKKRDTRPARTRAQIFHALLVPKTAGSNLCMPLPARDHALC